MDEITSAYDDKKTKPVNSPKKSTKLSTKLKSHTMKGVKLSPKYKNPLNPNLTLARRGVDPAWVAALRVAGQLESALIHSPDTKFS